MSIFDDKMSSERLRPLSQREVRIVADLEFREKWFFSRDDIRKYVDSESKLRYTIHRLKTKGRVMSINKNKYYLIPIKARSGGWSEHPFVLADEMFNGDGYYIGGWAAANYWRLTEQVPMKTQVYTNKRNGAVKLLGSAFLLHKTTKRRIENAVVERMHDHPFRILSKEDTRAWLESRDW